MLLFSRAGARDGILGNTVVHSEKRRFNAESSFILSAAKRDGNQACFQGVDDCGGAQGFSYRGVLRRVMMREFFKSPLRVGQLHGGQYGHFSMFSQKTFASQGLPRLRPGDIFEPRNTCSTEPSPLYPTPRPSPPLTLSPALRTRARQRQNRRSS
jgi:hypothetical protein